MKKKIVYITLEGVNSTVFYSQVYELLNSQISQIYDVELLCLQPINIKWNMKIINSIKKLKLNKQIKIKIIPYIGFKNRFSYCMAKLIIAKYLKKYNKNYKDIIVHCRGSEASLIARNTFKGSILADIRSAQYEELNERNKKRAIHFRNIEKELFRAKCVNFNFISNKLYEYYNNLYRFESNYEIIPCFGSFKEHDKNFLKNEYLTYLYVGGQQFYQKLNDYDKILAKVQKHSSWIFCLNGKKNIEFENRIIREANNKNINLEINYNLNKKELQSIYEKSDIGVIYRDNIVLNKVSCPVKVAEYLSNGLAVMMIGEIGDFFDIITADKKLGLAVSNLRDLTEYQIEKLKNIIDVKYKNYRFEESKKYSKEYCIKKYIQFYKEIE
ncbi:TPA: hypothetical protein ACGFBC_001951 [Clostridium perfringens]|uniref:hypothetical protein n=1 Tax=Clostridium perfringens TaxID=1502 RepID=UPI002AC7AE19|nr:hypothetical protein [Clostridium perfringens]MDZ4939343.1 hypothetical protein [Clostridium perfringens]